MLSPHFYFYNLTTVTVSYGLVLKGYEPTAILFLRTRKNTICTNAFSKLIDNVKKAFNESFSIVINKEVHWQ